jgi:hypothetical protein
MRGVMRIGSSLLLIAAGAILKWAVTARVSGLNLQNMGVILMVVGVIGLAIGLYLSLRPRWPAGTGPGPD